MDKIYSPEEVRKKTLEYFNGDELATSAWMSKYALQDEGKKLLEDNPDMMHRRMAKEFARIEKKHKHSPLTEEEIYNYFKNFKYIIPGGSIMSGLGNPYIIGSYSNCFVIGSPADSYSGIMLLREEQTHLMKRRGGVGKDLSTLRPKGTKVNNAAKTSTGASSFMDVDSELTNEVAQNGRRGALMITMDIRHPDIEDFITKKQDLTKVTGANISVKITDDFMEAVNNNSDYFLRFPVEFNLNELPKNVFDLNDESIPYNENIITKPFNKYPKGIVINRIKARDLWNTLIHCAWQTAEPGVMFSDRHHQMSPDGVYEQYKGVTTNPCQPGWANVLTKNGIIQFKDIQIGDEIWSKEGWTKVINKINSGIKDVFEYRTTAGMFYGTENHKIVSNGEKIEVGKAENIDIISGSLNERSDFNVQYIMDGLVLGDGSVHKASNDLIFLYIGKDDNDYFESEIKDLIVEHRPGITEEAYIIKTNIKASELPLTFEREIPERYFYNQNSSNICSFLRGLYSANGSVVDKRVTLKTSSEKIRDGVQILLSAVGIRSYYTTNREKKNTFSNGEYVCRESYDINISTDREIFYDCIGFMQKYKMEELKNTFGKISKKDKNHNIFSKTYISTEEVYDITVDNSTHTYWSNGCNVSNCGEIFMQPYDSCRLIHINFSSFVVNPFTKNAYVDFEKLYEVSGNCLRLADDLVDLEIEAVNKIIKHIKDSVGDNSRELTLWKKIRKTAKDGRRCGVGFTGLADMLAMLNLKFDSDDALKLIEQVMEIKFRAEIEMTMKLGSERGKFKGHSKKLEDHGNEFYTFVESIFPDLYKKLIKGGRRNVSWNTVAPTGTVSIEARTSSGIEPIFMPFYMRRKKCMSPTDRVDFVDKVGEKYSEFPIIHPMFEYWIKNIKNIDINTLNESSLTNLFEESPWYGSTANDIDWRQRVKLQSIVQKFTTHSISSTVNLPKSTTETMISDIYMLSWMSGLKGITVYRDGCRDGILNAKGGCDCNDFAEHSAPKRPKTLPCKLVRFSNNRERWIAAVGIYENKPYEIFTGLLERLDVPGWVEDANVVRNKVAVEVINEETGEMETKTKSRYDLQYKDRNGNNVVVEGISSAFNEEYWNYAKFISGLLRHGMPLKYVIDTVDSMSFGGLSLTTWKNGVVRALRRFLKDEELSDLCPHCLEKGEEVKLWRENGCVICKNCGWTKCG